MGQVNDFFKIPQTVPEVMEFLKGFILPKFTAATLPAASTMPGRVIWITDATAGGGAQFKASDGVAWRSLG